MKHVTNYCELVIDGKDVIILSKNYNGQPLLYHLYDVIIGPKEIFQRFKNELFPKHNLDKGWLPLVRYID